MVGNLIEGRQIGQGLSITALSSIYTCTGLLFILISFSTIVPFIFQKYLSFSVLNLDMMWSRTWSVISALSEMWRTFYALKLVVWMVCNFLHTPFS